MVGPEGTDVGPACVSLITFAETLLLGSREPWSNSGNHGQNATEAMVKAQIDRKSHGQ